MKINIKTDKKKYIIVIRSLNEKNLIGGTLVNE